MHAPHDVHDELPTLVEAALRDSDAVMVLFTENTCRVADAVEPKLEALVRERFPNLRFVVVEREHVPALAAQLGVFAVPTVLTWFAGKESARFVRVFSLEEVAAAIERPYSLLFG